MMGFRFWTIENGELVQYERTGACTRCGQCCCTHTIRYEMKMSFCFDKYDIGYDAYDWSEYEGWSVFQSQGIWWFFKVTSIEDIPSRCPSLVGVNKCSEWQNMDTFRPICRYWPFHPSNLEKFPECGFRFERVNEEGE